MTVANNNQRAETRRLLASNKFHLLRRLSITTIVAMLITSTVLVFLYRRDQITEHEEFIAQANEEFATLLVHLLDDQIHHLATTSYGINRQSLRTNSQSLLTNSYIELFTAELNKVHEFKTLKLKIYNLSGRIVYSSVKNDIGTSSSHPNWLAKALRGQVVSHIDFRDGFSVETGELHNVYISERYIPIDHAGKRIGVLEIYTDVTPAYNRIDNNTVRITLIVFGAFAAMYAALFSLRSKLIAPFQNGKYTWLCSMKKSAI